jgi:hypothetical protein
MGRRELSEDYRDPWDEYKSTAKDPRRAINKKNFAYKASEYDHRMRKVRNSKEYGLPQMKRKIPMPPVKRPKYPGVGPSKHELPAPPKPLKYQPPKYQLGGKATILTEEELSPDFKGYAKIRYRPGKQKIKTYKERYGEEMRGGGSVGPLFQEPRPSKAAEPMGRYGQLNRKDRWSTTTFADINDAWDLVYGSGTMPDLPDAAYATCSGVLSPPRAHARVSMRGGLSDSDPPPNRARYGRYMRWDENSPWVCVESEEDPSLEEIEDGGGTGSTGPC